MPNADTLDPDALPLAARPQVVAANRIDILADPARLEALRAHAAALGVKFHAISAVTGEGVPELLETLWPYVAHVSAERALLRAREAAVPPPDEPYEQNASEAPGAPDVDAPGEPADHDE